MQSMYYVKPMENAAKSCIELDEAYFFAGGHRLLGCLLYELPSWPISHGDVNKAIYHLEKSLEIGPEFLPTMSYLIKAYLHKKRSQDAREVLARARAVAPPAHGHRVLFDRWFQEVEKEGAKIPAK